MNEYVHMKNAFHFRRQDSEARITDHSMTVLQIGLFEDQLSAEYHKIYVSRKSITTAAEACLTALGNGLQHFHVLQAPTNVGVVCMQCGVTGLKERHNFMTGYKRI
jgi:hypothetical protein